VTDAGVLTAVRTVLVVDWPSRDVPDTLARAGFSVTVHGGPGPEDYSVYEVRDGDVVVRPVGVAPAHVDLVYAHRPLAELPGIVAMAQSLGAKAVWIQSGVTSTGTKDPTGCFVAEGESRQARQLVERGGLTYIETPYIADAVRRLQRPDHGSDDHFPGGR
jgi:predicted CoA-binding protein